MFLQRIQGICSTQSRLMTREKNTIHYNKLNSWWRDEDLYIKTKLKSYRLKLNQNRREEGGGEQERRNSRYTILSHYE